MSRRPSPPIRRATYDSEHERSTRARGDRIAHKPTSLSGLLRWCQQGYTLEAPARLHDRDTADDGTPDHTGEAKGWLGMNDKHEPTDWRAVARRLDEDGFYLTPMRAAISHINDPNLRQLAGGLACNLFTPLDVTRAQDVPDWCAGIVMERVLGILWSCYSDRPIPQASRKSDAQLDAEAA